jgi:hypothetical protein
VGKLPALGLACLAFYAAASVLSPGVAGLAGLTTALVWIVIWAAWRDRRADSAAARDRALEQHLPNDELPPTVAAFLTTLDGKLDLPAEIRADIRAELADHLEDSIAAITAEGLDPDRAPREAIARLGRPEELARQLRAAHQSTRRLLAGAAGGVFQAGAGAIGGYILGALLSWLGIIMLSVVYRTWRGPIDYLISGQPHIGFDDPNFTFNSFLPCFFACVAAFMAGRRSVREFARASRRSLGSLAPWWAAAGALVIGYLLTFVIAGRQSWLIVSIELLIPVAFAGGALITRRPTRPRFVTRHWRAIIVLWFLVGIIPFGLNVGVSSGTTQADGVAVDLTPIASAYDRVAPVLPGGDLVTVSNETSNGNHAQLSWQPVPGTSLAGFQDVRVEVWRAEMFDNIPDPAVGFVPDRAYSAPFAIIPAVRAAGQIGFDFDFSHLRNTRWLIFLTGVGPDGQRHRLAYPGTAQSSFYGTIWDWLTAAD